MFEIANTLSNVLIVKILLIVFCLFLSWRYIRAIKEKQTSIWGVGEFNGKEAIVVGFCQLISSIMLLVFLIFLLFN